MFIEYYGRQLLHGGISGAKVWRGACTWPLWLLTLWLLIMYRTGFRPPEKLSQNGVKVINIQFLSILSTLIIYLCDDDDDVCCALRKVPGHVNRWWFAIAFHRMKCNKDGTNSLLWALNFVSTGIRTRNPLITRLGVLQLTLSKGSGLKSGFPFKETSLRDCLGFSIFWFG